MKLFGAFSACALTVSAWEQPKWNVVQQALNGFGDSRFLDWGAPIGLGKGKGNKWENCPAIDTSAIEGNI